MTERVTINVDAIVADAMRAAIYYRTLLDKEQLPNDVAKSLTAAWIQAQSVEKLASSEPKEDWLDG